MRLIALPLALALAASVQAGQSVEHPRYGYSLDIPTGWKHRVEGDKLWLAAAGGYRVRIEAKDSRASFSKDIVSDWYRTDGRSFQSKAADFSVLKKPTLVDFFGADHPAYLYAFGYEPGPGQAIGYVSSGSSKAAANTLHVRILAYGKATVIRNNRPSLEAALQTFAWPSPPVTADGTDPNNPRVASGASDLDAGTEVATLPLGGDDGSNLVSPSATRTTGGGLAAGKENYTPQGEFDRGSLSGGLGALANSGVRTKSENLKTLLKGRRNGIGASKTQAQKERSAQYLGFKRK